MSRRALAMLMVLSLASSAEAQGVWLRVHPRAGDTLHTRLEQQTEVTGTMQGPGKPGVRTVSTSLAVESRTIVQVSYPTSTLVLTVVDSANVQSSDEHAVTQSADVERVLRGQQLILQLGIDGSVESARDARGGAVSRELAAAMSAMPAVFPRRAVAVGEQWTREMPLPTGGSLGAKGAAQVNATFRLDSLGRGGNVAFVSMRGEILPGADSQGLELSGSMTGAMQLDQRRGWMTDSRVSVLVRSLITPPVGTGLAPIRFVTRVTQRLRTMDRH